MTDKVAIDRETLERVLECLVQEGRSLRAAEVREALEQKVEPDEQEAALQKIADFGQDQEPVAWIGLPGKGTPLYAAPPAPAAAPPAPAAVPPGYALVPVEPTDEMLAAMQSSGWMVGNYRAMIAAAGKTE